MAIIHASFLSKSLFRTVDITVILPVDKIFAQPSEEKPFKTLYLLHGLLGSQYDWISGTRIERWAMAKNLAVVMPAGENGFYIDQKETGRNYGEFIGEELVAMTRKMFPLSKNREDTFIGGLSMGGYGAMRNGLKYSDTFSHIISLSGALQLFEDEKETGVGTIASELSNFGDYQEALRSDRNPKNMIFDKKFTHKPKVFMAVGSEDTLLLANRIYQRYLKENGFSLTYYESKGNHDWDFWDHYIKIALDWLPLDEASQGLSSGHVVVDE